MADDRVQAIGDGWFLVHDGDRQWRVATASDAGATWVFVNGHLSRVEPENEPRTAGRKRSDTGVMSPMPATVVAVNAVPGQAVAEGDTVIVLEAMKMELAIKAPRSGVVAAVYCTKGDLVQPGVNLLELA